ncbi:MAG: hypothetical protein E7375_03450 [Clostridiales bacterium]|nr:hypothetical protein [Clostridiales bacterium]
MREFFLWLFSENNSKMEITLFSIWHIFYLVLIIGGSVLIACLLKNKSQKAKDITLKIFAYLTIGLYVADFFIMPLSDSYNGISAYKLPFNICTMMAILVPFAQFNKKFAPIKSAIVTLSLASSLMWMVYPGSALGGQPPFSYIIFQTFMYHGFLFAWGFLSLALGSVKLEMKKIWKELIAILLMLAWAAFGNAVFQQYDWFFITGSTFPFIPKWLMPIVVVASVFGVCLVVYGLYYATKTVARKIKEKKKVSDSMKIIQKVLQDDRFAR